MKKALLISREGSVVLYNTERFSRALSQANLCRPGIFLDLFSQPLHNQGRGQTALFPLPGEETQVFLRSLKRGGLLGPYLDRLGVRLQRAVDELRLNSTLHSLGAPVPEPVLVLIEKNKGGTVGTVYIKNSLDGLGLLQSKLSWGQKKHAIELSAQAIRKFHDLGGCHPDLQLRNLLITQDAEPRAYVIDLDRAKLGSLPSAKRRASELMRLYRSLAKRNVLHLIGRDGIAIFLSAYCRSSDPQESRALRRQIWQELGRAWRWVRLHALFYPGGATSAKLPPRHSRREIFRTSTVR